MHVRPLVDCKVAFRALESMANCEQCTIVDNEVCVQAEKLLHVEILGNGEINRQFPGLVCSAKRHVFGS